MQECIDQRKDEYVVVIDDGRTSRKLVVLADPIKALRGRGRGERLVEKLLAARADERERDAD